MNCFLCPRKPPFTDKNRRLIVLDGTSVYPKSRLLDSLYAYAEKAGLQCEKYLSEYDYDKSAAVYITNTDTVIGDSIYFNKINTDYYKNAEIINTDLFFDINFEKIQEQIDKNRKDREHALLEVAKFRNAARALMYENRKMITPYVNKAKILNYILRFLARNGLKSTDIHGTDTARHISQTTPWGIHTCYETLMQTSKNVFIICDEYRAVSSALVSGLAEAVNQCGYDTVTYYCSLIENCPEHLAVPELSIAFFTENRNHPYPFRDCGEISASRFLRNDISPLHKSAIRWNNELTDDFIDETVFALYEAMECESRTSDLLAESFNEAAFSQAREALIKSLFT